MKLAKLGLLALFALSPVSFASDTSACQCSTQCQKKCEAGESESCKCDCGCKETGKCKHGKCGGHD